MTRLLLAVSAAAFLLAAPVRGLADEPTTSAAPSAAPAAAGDTGGGCMPGGQCCGGGSCKAAEAEGGGSGGDCPCKRKQALKDKAAALKAAEQQSAPANP